MCVSAFCLPFCNLKLYIPAPSLFLYICRPSSVCFIFLIIVLFLNRWLGRAVHQMSNVSGPLVQRHKWQIKTWIFNPLTRIAPFLCPSLLSPQPPSSTTRWSAAGASVSPSRSPRTGSTGAATAPPPASWRWTSSNCWETANTRWGKPVSREEWGGESELVNVCNGEMKSHP